MKEYLRPQAAARAQVPDRTFRLFTDRGVVLATPETRLRGRRSPKLYSTSEIAIGFISGDLLKWGVTTTMLAGLADWLRSHTAGPHFRDARQGKPVYIRLAVTPPEQWDGDFQEATPAWQGAPEKTVTVTRPNQDDPSVVADRLLLINLAHVLRSVEESVIDIYRRQGLKPSDCLGILEAHTPEIHTDEEVAKIKPALLRHVLNGDKWPDA